MIIWAILTSRQNSCLDSFSHQFIGQSTVGGIGNTSQPFRRDRFLTILFIFALRLPYRWITYITKRNFQIEKLVHCRVTLNLVHFWLPVESLDEIIGEDIDLPKTLDSMNDQQNSDGDCKDMPLNSRSKRKRHGLWQSSLRSSISLCNRSKKKKRLDRNATNKGNMKYRANHTIEYIKCYYFETSDVWNYCKLMFI